MVLLGLLAEVTDDAFDEVDDDGAEGGERAEGFCCDCCGELTAAEEADKWVLCDFAQSSWAGLVQPGRVQSAGFHTSLKVGFPGKGLKLYESCKGNKECEEFKLAPRW